MLPIMLFPMTHSSRRPVQVGLLVKMKVNIPVDQQQQKAIDGNVDEMLTKSLLAA